MEELLQNRLDIYIDCNERNQEKSYKELLRDLYNESNIRQEKITKLRNYFEERSDEEFREVFENPVDTIMFFMDELGIE
jgi:hypothetical protein